MLKTFDLTTERFSGTDYQENKFAKIFYQLINYIIKKKTDI